MISIIVVTTVILDRRMVPFRHNIEFVKDHLAKIGVNLGKDEPRKGDPRILVTASPGRLGFIYLTGPRIPESKNFHYLINRIGEHIGAESNDIKHQYSVLALPIYDLPVIRPYQGSGNYLSYPSAATYVSPGNYFLIGTKFTGMPFKSYTFKIPWAINQEVRWPYSSSFKYGTWVYSIVQTQVGANGYIRLVAFRNGKFRVVGEQEQERILGYKKIMNAYDPANLKPDFLKGVAVGTKPFSMEDETGY